MDLAETITVLVAGELPGRVTDRSMAVPPLGESSVDVIFIGVHDSSGGDRGVNQRAIVTCLAFSSIRITTMPERSIIPKTGGFSFARVPRPASPLQPSPAGRPPFFSPPRDGLMSGHHIDFVTFDLAAEDLGRLALDDPFAELSGHLLGVVGVEV